MFEKEAAHSWKEAQEQWENFALTGDVYLKRSVELHQLSLQLEELYEVGDVEDYDLTHEEVGIAHKVINSLRPYIVPDEF